MVDDLASNGADQRAPALFFQEVVLFPKIQISLVLDEERGRGAIATALSENSLVAFIPAEFETEKEGIGVLTQVLGAERTSQGLRVDLRGLWRVKVLGEHGLSSGVPVKVERLEDAEESARDETLMLRKVRGQIDQFRELIPDMPAEIVTLLTNARTASELSDLCAMSPTLTHKDRLELLSTLDPVERLTILNKHFDRELETLRSMAEAKPIPECEVCADLADRAFDAGQDARAEAAVELLNHIVGTHTTELLNVLAEKYGPAFVKRRSLR